MTDLPDLPDLPRDEDGFVKTSAEYGHRMFVRVTYNTDPEGVWVDDDDYSNQTLHGPFADGDEAQAWMDAYPDGDRDLKDMDVVVINAVRPVAAPAMTYTAEDVSRIVNDAIDDIDEFVGGLPDEGVRDALNLLVNVVGARVGKPEETLGVEDVIGTNYDVDPETVTGWIGA